jgi:phenylalanyl-tRNA synthetase alpha chain
MKTSTIEVLSQDKLVRSLGIRDLCNPAEGPHSMQELITDIHTALASAWGIPRQVHRVSPVVAVRDNYDRLGYPPEGVAREARYTRYVASGYLLRTQTSAAIPMLLDSLALCPPDDVLLVCPGITYRRDSIDRLHTGEPHQMDLWRIACRRLGRSELLEMIDILVGTALPGWKYRTLDALHPYTIGGLQIDAENGGEWVEIGECGVAAPGLLARCGLDPANVGGLAMGIGLDRLVMLRKGIDDIRLLRSEDPRVASQMLVLSPYRAVSNQPAVRRDLSVAVDSNLTEEDIGDMVRDALGDETEMVEAITIAGRASYDELPPSAITRMGMKEGQLNLLVRIVIRHPVRTLTAAEANRVRNKIYDTIHKGDRKEIAGES